MQRVDEIKRRIANLGIKYEREIIAGLLASAIYWAAILCDRALQKLL